MGVSVSIDKPFYLAAEREAKHSLKVPIVSTLKAFFDYLEHKTLVVEDAAKTEIADALQNILLNNPRLSAENKALIIAAARRNALEENVLPALESGQSVISNGSYISCSAEIGFENGILNGINDINRFTTEQIAPDVVLIIESEFDPNLTPSRKQTQQYYHFEQSHCDKVSLILFKNDFLEMFADILKALQTAGIIQVDDINMTIHDFIDYAHTQKSESPDSRNKNEFDLFLELIEG